MGGIPIPNCKNPDGTGTPCAYPSIEQSFDKENITAWSIWIEYPEQVIRTEATMAGAMSTLNLASLAVLFEMLNVRDRPTTYKKIRVIFDEWRRISDQLENTKTKKSMERTKRMRRDG
jgi:hypothetical protein